MKARFKKFKSFIIILIIVGQTSVNADPSCPSLVLHDLTSYKSNKSFNDGGLDGYNELMQEGVKDSLKKTGPDFYQALKNGDSHAKHLEAMGFKFHPDDNGKLIIGAPDLHKVVSYYDNKMLAHVDSGNLNKEKILKMSRIFYKGNGKNRKLVAVPLGDEVPREFLPFEGSVDKNVFYEFIADGKFIIGENIQLNSNQSFFMHDLAHFTSFIDHPQYMEALVDYSKDVFEAKRTLLATNKATSPPLRFEPLETLTTIKSEHKNEVKELLKIPSNLKNKKFVSVKDLKQDISKLSTVEIDKEIDELIRKFPFFMDYIGGSSRDIAVRSSSDAKEMGKFGFFGRTLIQRNHELKNVSKNQKMLDHFIQGFRGLRKDKKVEELAKFKSYVHGVMNISPDMWFTSLKGDELVQGSPVQEFFRKSGLDQYEEYQLYNIHNAEDLKGKPNKKTKSLVIKSMLLIGGYFTVDKLITDKNRNKD